MRIVLTAADALPESGETELASTAGQRDELAPQHARWLLAYILGSGAGFREQQGRVSSLIEGKQA
jgi:hypothetical protein